MTIHDIGLREYLPSLIMAIPIILLGIFPSILLDLLKLPVQSIAFR
jgi:NADH:ubiquinone oxidoreductase subunit 4 (subunit M)